MPAAAPTVVAVKELAAFVHRRGDLHYRYQSATLAAEGIARQKAWQQGRAAGYRREVRVGASHGGLAVSGRVDGWDADAGVVEEVKTTRADAAALHRHAGHEHLAQVRLYAALLALAGEMPAGLAELRLRLVYLHPEQPAETVFEEAWTAEDLIAYFEATCGCYLAWLGGVRARLAGRNRRLRALRFPFPAFRGEQRRLAAHVYRCFRDAAHTLAEAPTGAGKTVASVFPALKAMGEGELDRLLFLNARDTGKAAAEAALARCGGDAVAVVVTARERICFNPELPCDPAECAYARGYYERQPAARRELLTAGVAGRERVAAVARRHRVCPFELALDAAAWADVVVGDYNYVFDPVVRLRRLGNPLFARAGLVVDEAHQLGDRVGAMLGATLPRVAVLAALGVDSLPPMLAKALRSVDRALARLPVAAGALREVPPPEALCRAVVRATTALATAAAAAGGHGDDPVTELGWLLLRFGRAVERADPQSFHYLASGRGRRRVLEIVCTAPAAHIQETLQPFHGSVRLSGTLAPTAVYQRLHGFDAAAPVLAVGQPTSRLGVFAVADVSTYYRDRAASLAALVALVGAVRRTTPGSTLVAFPSFDYLEAAASRFGGDVCRQQRAMDDPARADLLRELAAAGAGRLGLVVMGGLFAESVDFDSARLRAVVVVGPGLPPPSLQRDLVAADHATAAADRTAADADGQALAYLLPAMTRVAQTVGRVARGGAAGAAVLVDPRFATARYRDFLPGHWRVQRASAAALETELAGFWATQGVADAPNASGFNL